MFFSFLILKPFIVFNVGKFCYSFIPKAILEAGVTFLSFFAALLSAGNYTSHIQPPAIYCMIF